jgi:SAM-dependent methyltransferase
MGIPPIKKRRIRKGRTIGFPADVKARSVLDQFNFYIAAIGLEGIQGKAIAEIGPGDALPLAILFLAAGAKRYVAVDRFMGDIFGPRALELYDAVVAIAPQRLVAALNELYRSENCASVSEFLRRTDRVQLHASPIEQLSDSRDLQADYIVSFNVIEHLADLPQALRGMGSILSPTGRMIHRIDYGPHDIWQRYRNPLTFLTIPAFLWRMTTSNRGCPNRVRHQEFMAMVHALGLESSAKIGRRASSTDVIEARPYLAAEFRHMSDQDIAVLDAEVMCGFDMRDAMAAPYMRTLSG